MKSILQNIFEAAGKPSDVKKYKKTERKEKVHFRGGDMYDTHDPGYDDEFSYFSGTGNGYIKDKEGHVYDVITNDSTGDAGAIAGGSHDYYVTIKKANGKDDFCVHGWTAIMSKGSNTGCIADIKSGHYLEDYIAKYYSKYDHGDKFKELAEKGDANAKSYDDDKAARIEQKKIDFDTRYVAIPHTISWEISDGQFKFVWWRLTSKTADILREKRSKYYKENGKGKKWGWSDDDPEYQRMDKEIKQIDKEFDEFIQGMLRPILVDQLTKVFKTKDLNKLNGIAGSFGYEKAFSKGKNFGYIDLGIDTKKKAFVVIDTGDRKIVDGDIKLVLNDIIKVYKNRASKEMIELFKKVSEAWKKAEGRKRTEYIKNNWEAIYDASYSGGWSGKYTKTKGKAKEEAGDAFDKIVRDHDFNAPYSDNNLFEYSLSLIQTYVQGDMDPEDKPLDKPFENPEQASSEGETKSEKKERGKNTVMGKGANAAAYDKMKAWHEGTRKQNLSNCSDAKLKMNYKVCKELGYEKEMKQIEAEAKKRDIVLESISISDIAKSDNEIDD